MQSLNNTLPTATESPKSLWLSLSVEHLEHRNLEQRNISLMSIKEAGGSLAFGEYFPKTEVSPDIIGYWFEIIGHYDQVLYRRFVHNKFPSFPPTPSPTGRSKLHNKERNKTRTQVQIELPYLPQASHICLWEQAYRSETAPRHPQKVEALHISLDQAQAQAI